MDSDWDERGGLFCQMTVLPRIDGYQALASKCHFPSKHLLAFARHSCRAFAFGRNRELGRPYYSCSIRSWCSSSSISVCNRPPAWFLAPSFWINSRYRLIFNLSSSGVSIIPLVCARISKQATAKIKLGHKGLKQASTRVPIGTDTETRTVRERVRAPQVRANLVCGKLAAGR